jgi:hypothetical protein
MFAGWMMAAGTGLAQQLNMQSLDKLAERAESKTEITMDEATLKSAVGFLSDDKADEVIVKETARNLKGIFLRTYEFGSKGGYKIEELKPLIDQLKAPNWSRFLRTQEDDELTEIWMHVTNGMPDGLLLIAAEEDELSVINLVGSANLADLSVLGKLGNLSSLGNLSPPQPAPAPPQPPRKE